jgi:leucyl-tRNA synthetase
VSEFYHTECPKCRGKAHRDVDTIDTFLDSAWYFLRYLSPGDPNEIFKTSETKKWLPVDLYIGGIEHAAGHLIYFRFITKFLHDCGLVEVEEPAIKLFNHGMVLDEKGNVMSKSKGNATSPRELMESEGIDVSRVAVLFFAPPGREILWQQKGIKGASRFLTRFYTLAKDHISDYRGMDANILHKKDLDLYRAVENTIKNITLDMERMDFNTAIALLMELLNTMYAFDRKDKPIFQYAIRKFTLLLAPFAPHLSEEIYSCFGKADSVFHETWPTHDETATKKEEVTIVIQVNGKVRSRLTVPSGTDEQEVKRRALEDERVQKYTEAKAVKKCIFVKDKLFNIVI